MNQSVGYAPGVHTKLNVSDTVDIVRTSDVRHMRHGSEHY